MSRKTRRPRLEHLEDRLAPATQFKWSGAGGNTLWSNPNNWDDVPGLGNVAPIGNGSEILVFPSGTANTVAKNDLPGGKPFEAITVDGNYFLEGNEIKTNASQLVITATNAINAEMKLNVGSPVRFNLTSPTGRLRMSGVVTNGPLTKDGAGVLELTNANTYPGTTQVTDGTLELNNPGANNTAVIGPLVIGNAVGAATSAVVRLMRAHQIGDLVNVTVNGDGRFDLNGRQESVGVLTIKEGGDATVGTGLLGTNGLLSLTGAGITSTGTGSLVPVAGVQVNASSNFVSYVIGRVDLAGQAQTFTVADSPIVADFSIDGPITGTQSLTKTGPGTLYLSQPNTFTGTTTVAQGTLLLVNAPNSSVVGPLVIGDGVGSAGTAVVRLQQDHQIGDLVNVTVNGDGRLDLNGKQEYIGALTINGGGDATIGTGVLGTNGLLTLNGGLISSTGAGSLVPLSDVLFRAASGSFGGIIGRVALVGRTQTFAVEDTPIVADLTIDGQITGSQGLTKTGLGTLYLSRPNTFTGTTTVADGALLLVQGANNSIVGPLVIGDGVGAAGTAVVRLQEGDQIADTAPVTVNGDGRFDGNGKQEYVGPLTVNGGDVAMGAADLGVNGVLTMSGGSVAADGPLGLRLFGDVAVGASNTSASIGGKVDLGGVTRNFTIGDGPTSYDLTIDAAIGNGGLVKTGNGWLRFVGTAANTYGGPTTVNSGVLALAKAAGTTAVAGPLVIGDGSSFTITDCVQLESDNQIADSVPVTIKSDGFLQLYLGSDKIGPLTMTGGLVNLYEQRTLTLSGDVTTTPTPVGGPLIGFLGAGTPGRLDLGTGTRSFNVADGAPADDLVVNASVIGSGGIIKNGPGTMRLDANTNPYSGPTTVSNGRLLVTGSVPNSTVGVAGGALGGTGSVATVNVGGGTLAPGTGVGVLRTGNVALTGASTFQAELNGTLSFDQLDVTGTVNLGGSRLTTQFGFVPAVGTAFPILINDGTEPVVGTFNGLPEGAVFTSGGKPYAITYAGGSGNDVVVTRIPAAVVVTPTETPLVTTEAGGTATFTVVLGSVPTADVTVALSSSDATEGAINLTTLTFTPANALTPQTVTVTGLADADADFNVGYSIVTAAAVSSDPEYSGLAVVDVPVVNLDLLSKGKRTFTDSDGDLYTVALTGPGSVAVLQATPTGNAPGPIDRIAVRGTDPLSSRLSVTVKKGPTGDGRVSVGGIEGGGLKSLSAKSSDLVGPGIHLAGPVGSVSVRDLLNGADVIAAGTPAQHSLFRAQVIGDGSTITLATTIDSFTAARVGDVSIAAPKIKALVVAGNKTRGIVGDFAADVLLTGAGVLPGKSALGTATISRTVTGSTIQVLSGNVGTFQAGRVLDSTVFVGFAPTDANDPLAGGAFVPGLSIGTFRVTGFNGLTSPAVVNTSIAAATVGTVGLKSVQTANGGKKFGVLADVQIGSVTVTTPSFRYRKGQPSIGQDEFWVGVL